MLYILDVVIERYRGFLCIPAGRIFSCRVGNREKMGLLIFSKTPWKVDIHINIDLGGVEDTAASGRHFLGQGL